MLILYLAVLIAALYAVSRMLLPEMKKTENPKPVDMDSLDLDQINDPQQRIKKLEFLLAEKNKNIKLLQTELTIFLAQVREFDKVKSLLDEEIHRLREQNRIFRSELGIPAVQPKENSVT